MAHLGRTLRNVFLWAYERGTLQYDIICALILAFVFLVPPSCFLPKKADKPPHAQQTQAEARRGPQT